MASLGINSVRTYTPPRRDLLDEAARHGLRVMVGLPWSQHVAFLDDRKLRRQIEDELLSRVQELGDHPAVLMFALGNEIPPSIVRWHGRLRIERFLRELYHEVKSAAPASLLTYVNFPPTEYLDVDAFDVCAFNVYLHRESDLRAYIARLQHVAGHKPLLLAEAGADSIREGAEGQARITASHIRTAFAEGGLPPARQAVSMIVGRDTRELNESGVCRAAIESLAESFSDGIVAPMFWLVITGLSGGIAYKAINTADSMIGHKTERYIDFGWAAARTDDVLNWLPARLSVLWLVLAAVVVPGTSPWRALTVALRDARLHDSPNAGWPEAAMAGALGVRLMGPRTYDGVLVNNPWMGDGRVFARISDIRTALRLYRTACGLQLGVLAILFVLTFYW